MTASTCPHCGSARVYRSRRRRLTERVLAILGGTMRRCHDCNRRYARFGHSMMGIGDLLGISRKLCLAMAMAAAVVLIMGTILWFNRAQPEPSPDTGCFLPATHRPLPASLFRV